MIAYIKKGHDYTNEVQTILQVFYPNRRYVEVKEITEDTITVVSEKKDGVSSAEVYNKGILQEEASVCFADTEEKEKEVKRSIKASVYEALRRYTGYQPKWGYLTGIRPAKTATELLNAGLKEQDVTAYFVKKYQVDEKKAALALEVSLAEQKILKAGGLWDAGLYIGIPFCPTRCLYCSFPSYPLSQYQNRVEDYLEALKKELLFLFQWNQERTIRTIYIGGGTPTSLSAEQLETLFMMLTPLLSKGCIKEFTVEAGRPDTITREKLAVMKQYGVNRISINPQTMNLRTLESVGRKHTPLDIERAFFTAREEGHTHINMDLIMGLPGEKAEDAEKTMQAVGKLGPEAITVHTLAVKRASRLKENFEAYAMTEAEEIEKMLQISDAFCRSISQYPYYMYRQKNMVGGLENVGYCRPGYECLYNVEIMEEVRTIFAVGAGASTKLVEPETKRIERIFNVKNVEEYIARVDEMIERKKKWLGFS